MAPPAAIEVEAVTDTQAITIPDPLTLQSVSFRREKAGKLIAGVAAPVDFELYKGHSHAHKPKAKRWDRESTATV